MKKCFKCEKEKLLSEFYAHSQMFDGLLGKCKECTKKDVNKNRKENIDYYRLYDRERSKNEDRVVSVDFPSRGRNRKRDPEKKKYKYYEVKYKAWTGSHDEYRNIHRWVESKLGKPNMCANCKIDGLSGRRIHWANVSRKYKKDIEDWVRLCARCHKLFDNKTT